MKEHEKYIEEHDDGTREEVSRITGYWETVAKDAEGNPHVYQLHRDTVKRRPLPEDEDFIRTAPPIKVNPTHRKRPTGEYDTYMFIGDTHHPFQNKKKMELINIAIRELMPDVVTYIGDDVDMASFSTFESRSEWLNSTQAGIDQFTEQLAQTRANIGDGRIIAFQGNHDFRLEREVRKYNADLMGLKRGLADELGVLTMQFLLRTEELGVEYVDGYPEGEYWYTDFLKAYHGRRTGQAITHKELKEGETASFVHGHGHSAELTKRSIRIGKEMREIFGMQLGTVVDLNLVPSGRYSQTAEGKRLAQNQNWQSDIGIVHVNEERAIPHLIPVTDDEITIFNKTYRS